ncbi:hypothetical protein J6590_003464 [Homalodisca vitripennis]|nr:hypothetical protein J6590_003464 [Homalodisca vitripennis]
MGNTITAGKRNTSLTHLPTPIRVWFADTRAEAVTSVIIVLTQEPEPLQLRPRPTSSSLRVLSVLAHLTTDVILLTSSLNPSYR